MQTAKNAAPPSIPLAAYRFRKPYSIFDRFAIPAVARRLSLASARCSIICRSRAAAALYDLDAEAKGALHQLLRSPLETERRSQSSKATRTQRLFRLCAVRVGNEESSKHFRVMFLAHMTPARTGTMEDHGRTGRYEVHWRGCAICDHGALADHKSLAFGTYHSIEDIRTLRANGY
jgi:hypothetical protein